ncbi:MAG: glycine zipper 2TM domain-containing protein [Thermoanaerobaculia bacterium]|jgi:hypothetical protein
MRETLKSNRLWTAAALLSLLAPLTIATACSKGADAEKFSESARAEKSAESDDRSLIERFMPPKTREIVVAEGTKITVRLTSTVSSQSSRAGDAVTGLVGEDVVVGKTVVIPAGSRLIGTVTEVHPQPKIGGRASLAFTFDRLETTDGKDYPIAAMFARTGPSETAKDTTTIIAGAVIGAVAGHQIDDDRGSTVGGLAGAGIGTAIAASTKGHPIVLPEKTVLRLTMRMPVSVEVRV